jgi:hypothetical protein
MSEAEPAIGGEIETPKSEPSWRDNLSSDFRDHDVVKKHDSMDSFVKEAVNAQSLLGRKGITIPTENSSVEEYSRFYNQLGRPEDKFDGYKPDDFPDVSVPDGIPVEQDLQLKMLKELYDSGLSHAQAERVYKSYIETSQEGFAKVTELASEKRNAVNKFIKEEFGASADRRLSEATSAYEAIGRDIGLSEDNGIDEWMDALNAPMADGTTLGEQKFIIQMFAHLGRQNGEGSVLKGKSSSSSFTGSKTEAQQELSMLMADPEFRNRLFDEKIPGHSEAVAKRSQLFDVISRIE